MTTGEIIKKRRIELGLSQEDLAQRVKFATRTGISRIETDKYKLNQSKIMALSKALQISPMALLGVDETTPMFTLLQTVGFKKEELENLTQADYDLMLTLMKGIIESKKKS
jgi:transcriptional regulator with XRE-family HTH domain